MHWKIHHTLYETNLKDRFSIALKKCKSPKYKILAYELWTVAGNQEWIFNYDGFWPTVTQITFSGGLKISTRILCAITLN